MDLDLRREKSGYKERELGDRSCFDRVRVEFSQRAFGSLVVW